MLIIHEDYVPFDEKVASINAWYDRHERDWVIEKMNKDGYQVGDVVRVCGKDTKNHIVAEMKKEYWI